MSHVLEFHLGPVQSFIAEARRTRDYWAGSFLLSWLIGKAMKTVLDQEGTIRLPLLTLPAPAGAPAPWADPTIAALTLPACDPNRPQPFLGSLINHFVADGVQPDAAQKAAGAVRAAWVALADAVREDVLDDFNFLGGEAERVRAIWQQQIGTVESTPFWEIYAVCYPRPGGLWWAKQASTSEEETALDRRKTFRYSQGAGPWPADGGNFCSMIPGLLDISGLERQGTAPGANQNFRAFWEKVRAHLVRKRYGDRDEAFDCLDLRPNESLSAAALVKRLFPLLALVNRDRLEGIVGWIPTIRASAAWGDPSARPTFWRKVLQRAGFSSAAAAPLHSPDEARDVLQRQSLTHWPSTSYVAAAHWIARAQRCNAIKCEEFAEAIDDLSIKLGMAEFQLWLRCVWAEYRGGDEPPPLFATDGAMFHESRLERAVKELRGSPDSLEKINKARDILRAIRGSTLRLPGTTRSYCRPGETRTLGGPPQYYALVRMDGDRAGRALADRQAQAHASTLFNRFAETVRGSSAAEDEEERLGLVAARNGVLLFAGGDELLAMFPAEDAFDAVRALRQRFMAERARLEAPATSTVAELTISGAVLFAHIRAPLGWAVRALDELLNSVAKKTAGRDALTMAVLDTDGLRPEWAAKWDSAQIEGFAKLLEQAVSEHGFLWSNQFYHDIGDTLAAFCVPARPTYAQRIAAIHGRAGIGDVNDQELILALIKRARASELQAAGGDDITNALYDVLCLTGPRDSGSEMFIAHPGAIDLAALDVLRVIGARWCKDTDAAPIAAAAEAA